ncbi:NrfD/PsrC family molybdoenzyme membrane anchor subunit [Hyalangium versicolor]|uniref:NrfD/PsrC family molybdoenzyme membrane anchor subunit n=1 Tax=Hyalangium versicolor TaxID=2861190 RepID=UPI001CCF1A73|nr:NrfD/PsrC family molybdoenzyme membrane anchor subunit [Hyalangium versicolor]
MREIEEGTPLLEQLERASDGRNVNPEQGLLLGEGAAQQVKQLEIAHPVPKLLTTIPSRSGPGEEAPSYYGAPAIKSPVWLPTIPLYFFVGGMAGATSALGAAVELLDGTRLASLGRRCRWIGTLGDAASSVLLIQDLGRPTRFLNMLRVFRPTSPMSMGAWVLAGSGAMNSASVAALFAGRIGVVRKLGNVASLVGGALGMPLAGYTAVLLSNSAVPVWQGTHRTLPLLFMASSMASAGSLLELFPPKSEREKKAVRRFGLIGKVAELAAGFAVEREAGRSEEIIRPLRQGMPGLLWKMAKTCGAAGLALSLLPGRQRWKQLTASVLTLTGALATRYAIYEAGKASTKDPHATFVPQRQGLGAAEVTQHPVASDGKPFKFPLPVVR